MSEPARILLVEDDESHAELIRRAFEEHGASFVLSVVDSIARAHERAQASPPDLIITDLKLPDGHGTELLPVDRDAATFAVVVMTSHGDEKVAVQAMKAGALDYVVKDERVLAEMPRVAERALREWQHILDKRHAEHELRQRERELRHAQKMEAIGRLASGIAHDFNNVLTGIIGCADVALSKLSDDSAARPFVAEIKSSAHAAGSIAGRLLTFVRRREAEARVVAIDEQARGIDPMLRHLLGDDVELSLELAAAGAHVRADPGELDHIVVNLALNARDAMPEGGRLTICTRVVTLAESEVQCFAELAPGSHVVLTVTDTGVGMDEATKTRAFEPFFTTKEIGKGTGLGLSTVYAIVRAAGGCVEIVSSPGAGASVRIYLPVAEPPVASAEKPPSTQQRGTGQTVLIVEDEPNVRLAMRHYLEAGGYRVLEANDARSAAECCGQPGGHVDLVVTDVVMPGGGGKHVTDSVRSSCPTLPVLYVSAHPAEVLEAEGRIEIGASVLRKPFHPEQLLERVARALQPPAPEERRSQPSLLLVEDHGASRMAMAELLRDHGFDVLETGNGAEAIAACQGRTIDLMLTDIGLPDVGGIELARRLRLSQPNLRVLFASGKAPEDPGFSELLRRADTAFVAKPVDIDVIARLLDQLLDVSDDRRPVQ